MNTNTCEPNNADAYLQGALSQMQEQEYTQHLDECEACREHLEIVAAGKEVWTEVQELLVPRPRLDDETDASGENGHGLPVSVQQLVHSLQPTDHPDSMGRLDNYEIKGVIGSGAMGVVLKAKDVSLDRIVSLKVMTPTLAASGTARSRFEREAKAAAAVHHPNVVAIHGVRTTGDLPYLVMPYLKGGSLHQRIQLQGPFSVSEILRVGSQIAAGLAAAHKQGVVHRDIKPSNIMLDDGVEAAIITDFGLARIVDDATMTRTGVISGTPEFMSPEQARGDALDCKSDLFSLGSLLYMLCTGYAPFRAHTPFGVLRKITDDAPKTIRQMNSEIPDWLCKIIQELHQKRPELRPSASETQATLDACLAHVYQPDSVALPAKYRELQSKTSSFRPVFTGAIAMLATATLIALFILVPKDGEKPNKLTRPMPPAISEQAEESLGTGKADRKNAYQKEFKLAFADSNKVGELEVEMHRGSIKVIGHESQDIIVKLSVPDSMPSTINDRSGLTQVRPRNLDFDIEAKGNYIKVDSNTRDLVTNVEIFVPSNTRLDLDSYQDGKLEVRDISGEVRARSYRNDITLINVTNRVRLYSYQGDFKANFSSVDKLEGSSFETYNGSIDLVLPKDLSATVRYLNRAGRVLTDFNLETDESQVKVATFAGSDFKIEFDEFVTGTINGGGAKLALETTNGDIRLRQQE